MLILTRKSNESIIIGNNIEVKILGIRGDQVSLGFSAPKNVSIYRKEVYESIQQENIQAVSKDNNRIKAVADSLIQQFPHTQQNMKK